jgi:D-3-phosphoglycerate dehydrogenase / 2-oxoglutarate reductase
MPTFQVIHTDPDLHPLDRALSAMLEEAGAEIVSFRSSPELFPVAAADAHAVLNADFKLTAPLISSLRNCRIISRFGTGVDNIDVPAATAKGIYVCNVPEFCTEEIANRAWTLLLACTSQLLRTDRSVREGKWRAPEIAETMQIEGQTLGLAGFGKIARAVAKRGRAFGMKLLAYDPYLGEEAIKKEEATPCNLETLFRNSDFLSLHVPATSETHRLVNQKTLAWMKPAAVLINTARGALVDEAALLERLQQGLLAAAGLEVFDPEPPSPQNPLLRQERVILTPHSGALTKAALERVRKSCVEAVVLVLKGQPPVHLVNRSVLEKA